MDALDRLKGGEADLGGDPAKLVSMVSAAIAATRGESLNELIEGGDYMAYEAEAFNLARTLVAAHDAVSSAVARANKPSFDDPLVAGAMLAFPAPPGTELVAHAVSVLADMRRFAALTINRVDPRKGRPPRDIVVRNAVRATVHYLHEQGRKKIGGGWKYVDRAGGRVNKRTTGAELKADGVAHLIIEVCVAFGLQADAPTIKGCHEDYIKLLREEKRGPAVDDYVQN